MRSHVRVVGPAKRVLNFGFVHERSDLAVQPGTNITQSGRLAQLGERRVRNAEVASSILAPSTNLRSLSRQGCPALRRFSPL